MNTALFRVLPWVGPTEALRRRCPALHAMLALLVCAPSAPGAVKDGLPELAFAPEVPGYIRSIAAIGAHYYVRAKRLHRLRRDGTVDPSFQCPLDGDVLFGGFEAIRPTSDGGLIVVGTFRWGSATWFVAKVDRTGAVHPGFVRNLFGPPVPASLVLECLVDARDRIYVSGVFYEVNGVDRRFIVRLLPDGTVDTSFAIPGSVRPSPGTMALTGAGRLLIADGFNQTRILRLNDDGTVDPTFAFPDGYNGIHSICVGEDGRIAVAASRVFPRGVQPTMLVVDSSGAIDPSFNLDLAAFHDGFRADEVLWFGDKILVNGGWGEAVSGWSIDLVSTVRHDLGLFRLNRDGSRDETWTRSMVAEGGFRFSVIDAQGCVVAKARHLPPPNRPGETLVRLVPGAEAAIEWRNTSARGVVTAGDPLIVGVVVGGRSPQRLLVRAVGPTLARFGVAQPLGQAVLGVYQGSELLLQESNARDSYGVREAAQQVGAFPLSGDRGDAAELIVMPPGLYTMVVSSGDGSSGTALAEVYSTDVQ